MLSHLILCVLWWLAFSALFRRGIHGMFPLHLAALSGFSDCCRKLLSSGTFMLTPFLPLESPSWHLDWCWLHICAGFDIDTPDDFGRTCLHAAAAGGWVIIPAYCCTIVPFLTLFLSFSLFLIKQHSPFCFHVHWHIIRALDYNRLVCQQNITVKAVSPTRNLECLNLLLNIGADFNRKDNFGRWDKHAI